MTYTLNPKKILAFSLLLAMGVIACTIAFYVGQSTRITEADASTRTEAQVSRTTEALAKKHTDALAAQSTAAKKYLRQRIHRTNQMWRKRVSKMNDRHRKETKAAQDAGYSSGSAAGYSSGQSAGVEEGIDKASDELICSDDSDVDLPPCFF